jgi:hypothetical protein
VWLLRKRACRTDAGHPQKLHRTRRIRATLSGTLTVREALKKTGVVKHATET